jgi:hypothetical protein
MKIRRVVGDSMAPTLFAGDIVVSKNPNAVKPGDIVIANVDGREVIKRAKKVSGKAVYLVGDNPLASTDSRVFGDVPRSAIVGVVMTRLRLAKATPAPKVKDQKLLIVPYALAAFIALVLIVLLLRIDTFVYELNLLVVHETGAKLTAAFSSVVLLFALPFLLRLPLSTLARAVSAVALLLSPAVATFTAPFLLTKTLSGYSFGSDLLSVSAGSVGAFVIILAIAFWTFYILGGQHVFNRLRLKNK